jgi:mono/diheme cytochrome c family protein
MSVVAFPIVVVMAALVWAPPPASQDAAAAITFYKDVLPVLQKNCQACHRPGQIGPFSMVTFTWL